MRNPFDKLSVRRDEEDQLAIDEIKKNQALPYEQVDKKKKKIRPEENRIVQNVDEREGFEVVGKKNKSKKLNDEEPNFDVESRKPNNRSLYMDRGDKIFVKNGKRQYDRHSGTGRGKEIAKGGAGGSHTWGTNTKQIADEVTKHLSEPGLDYYSKEDEACI